MWHVSTLPLRIQTAQVRCQMNPEEADGPLRHGNRAEESEPLGAKCATGCVCTEKGVKWILLIVKIHLDGNE